MIALGELMMILDLHRQGLSVSAIARTSGLDRKPVGECPEMVRKPIDGRDPTKTRAHRRAAVGINQA